MYVLVVLCLITDEVKQVDKKNYYFISFYLVLHKGQVILLGAWIFSGVFI